ncbi:M28 family peptidase [Geodermatophilus sp. YIM 151500]|uniref:M28 family peptidase n=1 Tax=Geodermatophilus sp. YIM 151500 TaxID=2984531 RepID=UPI0021E3E42F|nr:M28 family peptidase [Geodermatophilus sp. YIM 151500]MCV2490944.1 M28 family peptidase [Geodermatophilus sp. YIM 151500]
MTSGWRAPVRPVALLGVAVLLAVGLASVLALVPPAPVPADAPEGAFSAERAIRHLDRIAEAPRPPGSAAHAEARDHLVERLRSWGLATEVQQDVGLTDRGAPGTQRLAAVANVVGTLPGSAPTGTVLLAAHYDTVAGSPGAGDDGVGVATVLETARALSAVDRRNDVVVLLTDGEEDGLLGAEAFVRTRAGAPGTTVVLNHEARGVTGPPVTFRMTSPNDGLLDALSSAPGVLVDSGSEAVFEALPNDSDFRHFDAAGMHGYDTALVAGGAYYHSPLDDLEHLDAGSLQQMGRASLALARDLADRDLTSLPDGGEDLVTALPSGLLRYPASWEVPLAAGTVAVAVAPVVVARRRRALTLPRTALAAGAAAVVVVVAGLAGYALWQAALAIDPGQASAVVGEPYRPVPYQVAVLLAALAVALAVLGPLRRRLGPDALATGSAVLLAACGVLLAVALPGTSMTLVLPTLAASLGALVAAVLPARWRGIPVVAGLVPAAVLLAPAVWTGFDVGLGVGGPASAALLAVLLLLALPVADAAWPARPGVPRRRLLLPPGLALVLAVSLTASGLVLNREGATPPRQESLRYALDADTGEGRWISLRPPSSRWSRTLLPDGPEPLRQAMPWTDGDRIAHGPAAGTDLPGPDLEVLGDRTGDGVRELTLRLSSRRAAPGLGLWVAAGGATVREAVVAGRRVPVHGPSGPWDFGFQFTGAAPDGVVVRLAVDPGGRPLTVRIADRSDDLTDAPRLDPPAGRVLVTPQVFVSRAVAL